MPIRSRSTFVTNRSSPTSCTARSERLRAAPPSRPSRPRPCRPRSTDDRVGVDEPRPVVDELVARRAPCPRRRGGSGRRGTARSSPDRARSRCPRRACSRPARSPRRAALIASSLVGQVGCEAALVADAVAEPAVVEHLLQRVVRLGAPAQRLAEARRADRHDHELLQVDRVVGVGAAVDDVHHRHRQHVRVRPADVAVQRQVELVGRGLGDGEADAEDRVRAEAGLVVGAVELDRARCRSSRCSSASKPSSSVGDLAVDEADRGARRPCRGSASPPSRSSTASCSPVDAPDGHRRPPASRRSRARPRPRRWGCHASRGSRGRRWTGFWTCGNDSWPSGPRRGIGKQRAQVVETTCR